MSLPKKRTLFFVRTFFVNPLALITLWIGFVATAVLIIINSIDFIGPFAGGMQVLNRFIVILLSISLVMIILLCEWTKGFYLRSREHIAIHGRVDGLFFKRMQKSPCERAGLKLAIKDTDCPVERQ